MLKGSEDMPSGAPLPCWTWHTFWMVEVVADNPGVKGV